MSAEPRRRPVNILGAGLLLQLAIGAVLGSIACILAITGAPKDAVLTSAVASGVLIGWTGVVYAAVWGVPYPFRSTNDN